MLKSALITAAVIALAASASAQTKKPLGKYPKPAVTEASNDTLGITCSQAKSIVQKGQGVVLRTGPNRWDRYVHDGEACGPYQHDLVVQFVRTKDNNACHIGFTCEEAAGYGE